MKNRNRLIRKITNLLGIGFIMLGVVPVSVLSQAGSVYAAEQAEDGAAAIVLPAFTSYAGLLGSTSVESSEVEMIVGLPDISGVHGDWISLAILGPVLAEEDGDPPAEEPPAEEPPAEEAPPAEEPPAEEPPAEEPPAEEPPAEEPPVEEPPVEETPVEEPVEEAVVMGCTNPLADNYNEFATLDDDSCYIAGCTDPLADNYDAAATLDNGSCYKGEQPACEEEECAPEPEGEPAAEEEAVAEIVAAVAENDLVLADESGEPLDMASQETADLLAEGDPLITRLVGTVITNYSFVSNAAFCFPGTVVGVTCFVSTTPISDAIVFALPGETIAIAAGTYDENVLVDKDVILLGSAGGVNVTSFTLSAPVVNLASWTNINTDLVYVVTDADSQGSIQDGIDLVAAGGDVNVGEGTYEEELSINKPLLLNGSVGSPFADGPGSGAPILMQSEADWQTNAAIELGANIVTIQGFIFKGFEYGVDLNSHTGVDINNNMFLYYPTSGGGVYTDGTPLFEEYNIEFPPEKDGYGKFYNNECSDPLNDCEKNEGDYPDGHIYTGYTADVVVIKTGGVNGHEFFFTPDNNDCDPATDFYCVFWHADGSIEVVRYLGQAVSHVEFWNFENDDPYCGDGIRNGSEACDGDDVPDGYTCREDCHYCGDGTLQVLYEECEPGEEHCNDRCTFDPYCGDGELNGDEFCDPTAPGAPIGCRVDCTMCGDGVLQDGDPWNEECEPGPGVPTCNIACTYGESFCGDGELNGDEFCDPTAPGAPIGCRIDCTMCGDGVLQDGDPWNEECEPDDLHCNDLCTFDPWCGDGEVNGFEYCDPTAPGAPIGCRIDCTMCGDGVLQDGDPWNEECEPDDLHCNDLCTFDPWCGDGEVNGFEYCDPAADPTGAGDNTCRLDCTACGDGIINGDPLEYCDGEDYCNDECEQKDTLALAFDPHCSGPYTLIWSVINPNPFSVPNTHVVLDGVVVFDGTFPAGTEVVMGTTDDGPATHTMTATWEGGSGSVSSDEVCEPKYKIPPPVDQPAAGGAFIIPVTGADLLGALASQQGMFFSIGAGLLGLSLMIGRTKKKK